MKSNSKKVKSNSTVLDLTFEVQVWRYETLTLKQTTKLSSKLLVHTDRRTYVGMT